MFSFALLSLQSANAMVTPDSVASTWNCSSFPVAYQVEFVSDVDMQRREEIVITAVRDSTVIQRSQWHTEKHANVSSCEFIAFTAEDKDKIELEK
jgi:hypothetical protein